MPPVNPRLAIWLLLALAIPAGSHAAEPGRECLSYTGRVSLTGVLARAVAPGPPNYESTAAGDKPEAFWVVRLATPACVTADLGDPDMNPRIDYVAEVQLVITGDDYVKHAALLGNRVTVSGTLFGAHTGHHHTPVLLGDVAFER